MARKYYRNNESKEEEIFFSLFSVDVSFFFELGAQFWLGARHKIRTQKEQDRMLTGNKR